MILYPFKSLRPTAIDFRGARQSAGNIRQSPDSVFCSARHTRTQRPHPRLACRRRACALRVLRGLVQARERSCGGAHRWRCSPWRCSAVAASHRLIHRRSLEVSHRPLARCAARTTRYRCPPRSSHKLSALHLRAACAGRGRLMMTNKDVAKMAQMGDVRYAPSPQQAQSQPAAAAFP